MRALPVGGGQRAPGSAGAVRRAPRAAATAPGLAPPPAQLDGRPRRVFTKPPQIHYTVSKREITPEELYRLICVCARGAPTQSGSPVRRSYWQHWAAGPPDEEILSRLRMALHNSVAIAAAFTRDPRFASDEDYWGGAWAGGESEGTDSDEYAAAVASDSHGSRASSLLSGGGPSFSSLLSAGSSSSSGGSGSSLWSSPLMEWGSGLLGQRRRPRLIGFARAAGDYSLVATLHDVAIHPELRGLGIGARLVKKVVTQVCASDVGDVGLVTPSELAQFFQGCSFDFDREDSVPMALRRLEGGGGAVAEVGANEELKALLRREGSSGGVGA